jgi:hypothetical protein
MTVGAAFRDRIDSWDSLSRWERSELGRELRRLGLSYGEIMGLIPVKKSTLATWCREVKLTEEQFQAIRERTGSREGIPRDTNRKRHEEIEQIKSSARSAVPDLVEDPFWVAGTVLYWAEGAKTRNHLALNNTDPRALRLFIAWTRRYVDRNADHCNSICMKATTMSRLSVTGSSKPGWLMRIFTGGSSSQRAQVTERTISNPASAR